ncbi:hypothetical protein K3N28_14025 [Glycomyces sp. TRM65418]|uniref:hypothetical protein n=1 Tax=Glycomyces sp. TRM65418 TaxID=2867006 RepID=UPI001CE4FD1F|nr:hypothetical protein [Glycomyces sp. TRM65418]MCC3764182.1 hypothetical protein [Glycomyces sp. TRM65418]QZD53866.1 hypothetical protein K3N28_13960 [Glycomyces sp. TRM65418]
MARPRNNLQLARSAVGGKVVSRVLGKKNVFRVAKGPKGKGPDYVIVVKRNPKHDPAHFRKKLKALQGLGKRGKLKKVPASQISRTGKAQADYRRKVQDQINKVSDPTRRQRMQDEFDRMDADHIHELQAGGLDIASNMWMLDSGVNRSVGSQIMNRIKDLPDGSTFQIAVSRW